MKNFNFLSNLLQRVSAMSGMRAETINYDGQPAVNRRANMTSVLRHCKASDVRVAQEWCENGARVAQEWCESGARVARERLQKSSARVAQGLRKSVRFAATILVLLWIGVGNVWGETSTLTFTAACGGSGTADDGASWTVTSDGSESTYDSGKGIHYGTNNSAVQYITLTCTEITGTITKVVVHASSKNDTGTHVSVKVGATDFKCNGNTSSAELTGTDTEYEFTGEASGTIEVKVGRTSSTKGAIYCKSITVTYTPAPAVTHTVTWNDNGGQIKSEEIAEGSTSYSCPPAPSTSARGNCGDKFMGWTNTANYSGNSAPAVLFTDENGVKPAINSDTDFYAVFADEEK